jgi:hypothetical protein
MTGGPKRSTAVVAGGITGAAHHARDPIASGLAQRHFHIKCRPYLDTRDLQFLHGNRSSGGAPPFPLSSRPKRSAVERSAVLPWQPVFRKSTALSFVISTEAKRSGEICGSAVPSWKCFSQKGGSSRPRGLVIGVVFACLFRRRLDRRKCPGIASRLGAPPFGHLAGFSFASASSQ